MKNNKYILEGIFQKFDTMNRNPSRPYIHPDEVALLRPLHRKNKINKIFNG